MKLILSIFFSLGLVIASAQTPGSLPFQKIMASCLDADVKKAKELIRESISESRSPKEVLFLNEFNARFAHATDTSSFLKKHGSSIDKILKVYHAYWRMALLDPETNYDAELRKNLSRAMSQEFGFVSGSLSLPDDTLDSYLKKYIAKN